MRPKVLAVLLVVVGLGSVCAVGARHTVHVLRRVAHHLRGVSNTRAIAAEQRTPIVHLQLPAGEYVVANNPKVFLSPYTWYQDGENYAQTNNAGAYLKCQFTGRSFKLGYDMSPYEASENGKWATADMAPVVRVTLDGSRIYDPPQLKMPKDKSKTNYVLECCPTGLSGGNHTIQVQIVNLSYYSNVDMWNTPKCVLRLTRVYLSPSETLDQPAYPFIRPKRLLAYGDSITKGISSAVGNVGMLPWSNDATTSYVTRIANTIDAEYGIVAYGGTGYTVGGEIGVPSIVQSDHLGYWDHFDRNHSRLVDGRFDPQPDLITVNLHTNDTLNGVGPEKTEPAMFSDDNSLFPQLRAACGPAMAGKKPTAIAILVPPGGMGRSAIKSSVRKYNSQTGDSRLFAVDLGIGAETGLKAGLNGSTPPRGIRTPQSEDNLHPNRATQARIGDAYAARLLPML